MKDKYKLAFIDMACRFAETSSAERLKVGALIVKNDSIISLGVNGQPPKWHTEVCEEKVYLPQDAGGWVEPQEIKEKFPFSDKKGRYYLKTCDTVRHAEQAALEKLWNSTETAQGAEMFISHSPCPNCCIKILTSEIKEVTYRTEFRDTSGLEYLVRNNIKVNKL